MTNPFSNPTSPKEKGIEIIIPPVPSMSKKLNSAGIITGWDMITRCLGVGYGKLLG
jgi:hypothetical protein